MILISSRFRILHDPGTNQSIFIRGAGSGRTLLLIDGVPVNDPTILDNSYDINLIPVTMIERIEINEAFAAVPLAIAKELGLPEEICQQHRAFDWRCLAICGSEPHHIGDFSRVGRFHVR